MSGILFLNTLNMNKIREFYRSEIGMIVWREQKDCIVLQHGNFLLGFCQRETIDTSGTITFFFDTKEEIDALYHKLISIASSEPKENTKYGIYHFFIKDPESRIVEFQTFLNPVFCYKNGEEMLLTRRSIRNFQTKSIPKDVLHKIFDICRYSPTSKNSQSYYYLIIESKHKLEILGAVRGENSSPIKRAPMAIAICADPTKSRKPEQDACIAAYQLMIACWYYGIGTCWIGSMDSDEIKEKLGIPKEHVIATIIPVGYPAKIPSAPRRRESKEMVKFTEEPKDF